ncbi:MAG TPA: TfoX/Sxy family protein [Myxococcota bacterium]|nr:TfoX/Sxy family protein [Myxococcota bacterium]HND30914.1 TfoX/Sxy family protein [Myxococcota bacterium]
MTFPKPSPELIARMKAALPPQAQVRPMFGQVAFFLNGNMGGGTWVDSVMLRLSPEDMLDAEDQGATFFDPMGDRPMKDYRLLPATLVADAEGMQTWLERAVRATEKLPPKLPKAKGETKKKKA